MFKFLSAVFSSLDALIFSSPEPKTIDFQLEINFKHALRPSYQNYLKT